jgi:hypothetical protein
MDLIAKKEAEVRERTLPKDFEIYTIVIYISYLLALISSCNVYRWKGFSSFGDESRVGNVVILITRTEGKEH